MTRTYDARTLSVIAAEYLETRGQLFDLNELTDGSCAASPSDPAGLEDRRRHTIDDLIELADEMAAVIIPAKPLSAPLSNRTPTETGQ